jgi:tetratricopeptide (TPR) repeat protein
MKKILVGIIVFSALCLVFADVKQVCRQTDLMDENGEFVGEKDLLLSEVAKTADRKQRAELYWRMSRAYLNMAEDYKSRGMSKDDVLEYYKQGEQYADMAIENDSQNPEGYFWKGVNIGSWGNTKGIIEGLGNAGPMKDHLEQALIRDPNHADSYFVLCKLYTAVPGWPVSFGNVDYAVSFGRKAVSLLEKDLADGTQSVPQYGYYTALAAALWNRNWDTNKRLNERTNKLRDYTAKSNPLEKNSFFECQVSLKPMSDRMEARELIQWVISEIGKISAKNYFQKKDLEEAQKLRAEWK